MINRKPLIVVLHETPRTLQAIRSFLQDHGFEAAGFRSLTETFDFILQHKPELVLADQAVTKAEGLEFLEVVKTLSFTTEAIFLPHPLHLDGAGASIHPDHAGGLLRIVERLLHIVPLERVLNVASFS